MLEKNNVAFEFKEKKKKISLHVDLIEGYQNRYEAYFIINKTKVPLRKINGKRDTQIFINYMKGVFNESI